MKTPTRKPRKGDEFEVFIEALDSRGHAIARHESYTFHVRGALPGARVRVSVRKRRRAKIDAVVVETLEASVNQVEARCAHFGTCGGCTFQDLAYPAQLTHLGLVLETTLAPLGAIRPEPILPCASPWNYRNKMDFTFGNRRWIEDHEPEGAPNGFAVGLHVPGRFDRILDVHGCDIAFEEAAPILADVRALALELGLDAWDVREHRGLLRHVVLRKGFATGEIMVDFVTTERAEEQVGALVDALLRRHAEITTVVQHVNDGVALIATGAECVLFGPGFIHEVLAGISFRISAASFFQTNTAQAEELVRIVREEVALEEGQRVFDLYCGSGLFSLALARDGAEVVGFELVESAIADANENAGRNGIESVRFVAGDLVTTLGEAIGANEAPDVCVVDPPRAGMHPQVIAVLVELAPRRIVYVSCNPASAARDLAPILAGGYSVRRIQPVDLFPHTPHLECVFTLERGE